MERRARYCRIISVAVSLLVLSVFLTPASAQIGDVFNKARKKAQDKLNQINGNSTTSTQNGQTAHNPINKPWYMLCNATANTSYYWSDIFPLEHDPNVFLADTAAWRSFAKDRFGISGDSHASCEQLPTEQEMNNKKDYYENAFSQPQNHYPPA